MAAEVNHTFAWRGNVHYNYLADSSRQSAAANVIVAIASKFYAQLSQKVFTGAEMNQQLLIIILRCRAPRKSIFSF